MLCSCAEKLQAFCNTRYPPPFRDVTTHRFWRHQSWSLTSTSCFCVGWGGWVWRSCWFRAMTTDDVAASRSGVASCADGGGGGARKRGSSTSHRTFAACDCEARLRNTATNTETTINSRYLRPSTQHAACSSTVTDVFHYFTLRKKIQFII